MDKLAQSIPSIINAAAQSLLGLFALIIIALSALAYFFFSSAQQSIKVAIFFILFLGAVGFGVAMFRATPLPGLGNAFSASTTAHTPQPSDATELKEWQTYKRMILVILNEDSPHIHTAAAAFEQQFLDRMGPWHKIVEKTGGPNDTQPDDLLNQRIFNEGIKDCGKIPDVIVTVGTQVSIYAATHYPFYPRYFLAVSDPIASKLINPYERTTRDRNVSGYSNGIRPQELVETFSRCFPHKRFGFLYNDHQLQDVQMKRFLDTQNILSVNDIKLSPNVQAIGGKQLLLSDIFFGWNALNKNIDDFVELNPEVAFIGPQYENIHAGVVASYGSDFAKLGREAADYLVDGFFARKLTLGSLPIQYPNTARMLVSTEQLRHFNLKFGEHCNAMLVP